MFDGIYTPIITPYHLDGSVDWQSLEHLTKTLVNKGVHGIISGGSTGENYTQTPEERLTIAAFIKKHIKSTTHHKVAFIVGTGAMLTRDSLILAQGARDLKADGILLGSPPYAVPTERENATNALAIDAVADLPIILYNYPGRMGADMGPEFLDRVGRSANICMIKESSGDINRLHLLARDYPHIQLSCGMDDQALEFFVWGAKSWVCGGSNFLPSEHIAMYNACVIERDFTKGRAIMSAMMPLMRILEQGGKFIQSIKYGVHLAGIDAGRVRPPLQELQTHEKRELEQVIAVLKTTIKQIESEK